MGVGLCDHTGKLLRAQALWYESAASAMAMEAYAIRDGIQLAYNCGLRDVIIESDAQQLVRIWSSSKYARSEVAAIMHEVEELSRNMASFQLDYLPREANELAHL